MSARELHFINVTLPLRDERGLFELKAVGGRWTSIVPQETVLSGDGSFVPMSALAGEMSRLKAAGRIDLKGFMMLPGFVDAHMHLDKAYSLSQVGNASGTLLEAIANYGAAAPSFSKEEIRGRIRKAALRALSYGTTTIRTHLDFRLRSGIEVAFRTIYAALEVREELKGIVDMQLFPMCPYDRLTTAEQDAIEEALRLGMDGMGGAPHLSETPESDIDRIFATAARWGKPIDLHADESDDPSKQTVAYIVEKAMEYGYGGKVTVDHLCSLSAMDTRRAEEIIGRMKAAGLSAVTLPPVNMYLQGRGDSGLIRRGTTRIRELLDAQVPLAVASDNIQDPFHPFGQGDLLKIGLVTAYAAHMGSSADLRTLLRMMTEVPAGILGLTGYGITEGHSADFVLIDALRADDLFTELPVGRTVYKQGRPLYTSVQQSAWGLDELDRTEEQAQ
ncbi:amidohydrolase family protein [Paenibacillus sp. NPDC056579]|uniref:amidohydrolase family protein n=1 Tax=Paenibacillus sp. NPDC056579 TaxID=3345871 RepID=UPI00367EE0B3